MSAAQERLDLVVLGNLLVDDIVQADGSTRMGQAGGAVLYLALAAHLCGLRVGVVSVRGDDYPTATLDALAARGIKISGIRALRRQGLRTWLLDEGRRRQVVHRLGGPSHAEVSPRLVDIPAAWRNARAFHLAPMPVAIQGELVKGLAGGKALLSLDPYGLLRDQDLSSWRNLLSNLDFFFLSEDEMLLSAEVETALRSLLPSGRPMQVLFKQGDRGGLLVEKESSLRWPVRAASIIDTTGAGDSFAAGFLAGRLRGESTAHSCLWGVVAASYTLAGQGPEGLLVATPQMAQERFVRWK